MPKTAVLEAGSTTSPAMILTTKLRNTRVSRAYER